MNTTLQTLTQLQEIEKVICDIQQKIDVFPEIMEQFDRILSEGVEKVARLQASIEEQERTRRSKEVVPYGSKPRPRKSKTKAETSLVTVGQGNSQCRSKGSFIWMTEHRDPPG